MGKETSLEKIIGTSLKINNLPEPYFDMSISSVPLGWTLNDHCHEHYHMNYILSGSLVMYTPDESFKLIAGQVCIVPPQVIHSISTNYGFSQFGISFQIHPDTRGIISILRNYVNRFTVVTLPSFEQSILELHDEIRKMTNISNIKVAATLDIFVANCIEKLTHANGSAFRHKLIELLKQHISSDIKLNKIVKELAISQTHLERLSQKEFGCGAIELFHKIKINHACTLLIDKNRSIKEIASVLGYSDSAYFCRFFRKKVHMTPGEYRNQFKM